jgi:hemolysin activation/secretion protein
MWRTAEWFGDLQTVVSAYMSLPAARSPVLALRGGARQVWGNFPAHEAAFLGGWDSLRGYETERFAGDAALWGSAELRAVLGRPNLLVRGDLGALAFADAGRVYLDDASPGGWHSSGGGGLFFSFDFQGTTVSSTALYARGETDKLRLQLGLPF